MDRAERLRSDAIRIEDRWYVLATSSLADDRTHVLKHGDTFAVLDRFGDINTFGSKEYGLYHEGTRFLSQFELRVNALRPMLLNSSVRRDNSLLGVNLTTPDLVEGGRIAIHKSTVQLFRTMVLYGAGLHERLRIANYAEHAVRLELSLFFGCDYADIFEVRGYRRARRGRDLSPVLLEDRVVLGYEGLDGALRRTAIATSHAPVARAADHVAFTLELPPGGRTIMEFAVFCEPGASINSAVSYAGARKSAMASCAPRTSSSTSGCSARPRTWSC